ncbi:AI-2E family transporter YdiK [Enterobacter sp. 22452]|uniref:AI-2E family transporter YdiK n=1 Tax=Enterobacter TaxID=547 RepID=UPI003F85461E
MSVTLHRDLTQTLFSSILIMALLIGAIWVASPFLLSIVWAGLIVIATWPLFTLLQRKTGWHKGIIVGLMMLFLTLIFLLPLLFCMSVFSTLLEKILSWFTLFDLKHLPDFAFLAHIPWIGEKLHSRWLDLINEHTATLRDTLKPWVVRVIVAFMQQISHIGALLLNGVLMLIACLLFYLHGHRIAHGLRLFARRLAAERGESAILLAGKTIQAVAMGIVLTAVIQSAFAGLGLLICPIPGAALLMAIIFVLCLMQLGPVLLMLPCVAWLFWSGQYNWGVLLLIWTVVAGSLDNVLKPVLIRRGAETSLFLIMLGVIGGLLTLGILGLFIGPVLLAVSWRLIAAWVRETPVVITAAKDMI